MFDREIRRTRSRLKYEKQIQNISLHSNKKLEFWSIINKEKEEFLFS
jgi:hypothetical protein